MIELSNIKFKDYLKLEDRSEYDFAINYAYKFRKPLNIFNLPSFMKMKFGLIKDLQDDMSRGLLWIKDESHEKGMLDYMMMLTGKEQDVFCDMSLLHIVQFKNYIVQEIEKIVKIESLTLAYNSTDEEKAAGIDRLNVYGVYNQLLSVAKGDPLKIPQVRKMKYEEAFVFLCNQKDNREFERRLWEIRNSAK